MRVGTAKTGKARVVRVSFRTPGEAREVLKKRKYLKKSLDYSNVYISPDWTVEQRQRHKQLVGELKERIKKSPEKRYYIKNGQLFCDEKALNL